MCNKDYTGILFAFRSGESFEVRFYSKYLLYDKELTMKIKSKKHIHNYNLSIEALMSFPYYNNQILSYNNDISSRITSALLFAVHPVFPIIAILSKDDTLRLIDYSKKQNLIIKKLGSLASSCAFSPDGLLLVIGFENGKAMAFNTKMHSNIKELNQNFYLPKLENLLTIDAGSTRIIKIKFSDFGDFMVLLFDNKRNRIGDILGGSYLSVFVKQSSDMFNNNGKNISSSTGIYFKLIDFSIPLSQFENNNLDKKNYVINSIEFSDDSKYILLSNQNSLNDNKDVIVNKSIFLVWDLINNQIINDFNILKNINFKNISLKNVVNAKNLSRYFVPKYLNDIESGLVYRNPASLYLNDINSKLNDLVLLPSLLVINYSDIALAGGKNGGIYLFNKFALYNYEYEHYNYNNKETGITKIGNNNNNNIEEEAFYFNFNKDVYATGKYYPSHCGEINSIIVNNEGNVFFTSGLNDQIIIQWRIINEDLFSDLDYFPIQSIVAAVFNNYKGSQLPYIRMFNENMLSQKLINDPNNEIINFDKFIKNYNNLWIKYQVYCINKLKNKKKSNLNIYLQSSVLDNNYNQQDLIKLNTILGKKSTDSKNLLEFNDKDELIYCCSSFIIYLEGKNEHLNNNYEVNNDEILVNNKIKQHFFIPDSQSNVSTQRKVSYFAVSKMKDLIAVGVEGLSAAIHIWHINSNLLVSSYELLECCTVINIKFSCCTTKLLCLTIQKDYILEIIVIDIINKVITNKELVLDSLNFKIKDIAFLYNNSYEFITVGIQSIKFWSSKGNQLICKSISIIDDKKTYGFGANKNLNSVYINNANKKATYIDYSSNKLDHIDILSNKPMRGPFFIDNLNYYGYRNKAISQGFEEKEINNYSINEGYTNDDINSRYISTYNTCLIIKNSILIGCDNGDIIHFKNKNFCDKKNYLKSSIVVMTKNDNNSLIAIGCYDGKLSLYNTEIDSRGYIVKITIKGVLEDSCSNLKRLDYHSIKSLCLGNDKIAYSTTSGEVFLLQFNTNILDLNKISKYNTNLQLKLSNFDSDPPICITMDNNSNNSYVLSTSGVLMTHNNKTFNSENNFFDKNALYIYHMLKRNRVIIAFDDNVEVFDLLRHKQNKLSFNRLEQFETLTGKIIDISISCNDNMLAVSSITNNNPVVHLYEIVDSRFIPVNVFKNFNSEIKRIDFSDDENYLFLEDDLDNKSYIKLLNKQEIAYEDTVNVNWVRWGLLYSQSFKTINKYYKDFTEITYIYKHPKIKYVAIGDKTGILRLFEYPSEYNSSAVCVKQDHTSPINYIYISFDLKHLCTLSKEEKSIMIYNTSKEIVDIENIDENSSYKSEINLEN